MCTSLGKKHHSNRTLLLKNSQVEFLAESACRFTHDKAGMFTHTGMRTTIQEFRNKLI